MKKKIPVLVSVFTVISIYYLYCNFFTNSMVTGTYVTNIKESAFHEVILNDSLTLFEDNQVISKIYGAGTYNIEHTLTGTKIGMNYANDSINTIVYPVELYRNYFSEPRIARFSNYYYRKVD